MGWDRVKINVKSYNDVKLNNLWNKKTLPFLNPAGRCS